MGPPSGRATTLHVRRGVADGGIRCLDVFARDAHYAAHLGHGEPHRLAILRIGEQHARVLLHLDFALAGVGAEIHHGDDGAAHAHHAQNGGAGARHFANGRGLHDFAHHVDAHGVRLGTEQEP